MEKKFPGISVIIPTYNESNKIEKCLRSIREQDYPQDKIEIIVVDDDSIDDTIEKAGKFRIRVVRNGKHDYDIGKSLGIQNSKNEYVLLMDADNFLTRKNWIKSILKPLLENKDIAGSQPLWFKYDKKNRFFDRYSTLFGITDPLTIYMNKRDRLMLWERKFKIGKVTDKRDYFLAEFNKKNLPTIGTVGFMIKKSYLMETNYKPSFSHLDCMQDLLRQGYKKFALVKMDIIHLHSATFSDFLGKLKRNFDIFIRDFDKRRFKWESSIWRKIFAVLAMSTFLLPLYHSIRGFIKIRDIAWFAHPFICFVVISMYLKIFLKWKFGLGS